VSRGSWSTGSRTHLGLRGERVKQAQEWLGHSDPATTLRHYVRLTTTARAKAVAGLDEVTRAALERAEETVLEDARPPRDNVVALASRRR
jgi:integrase